MSASPSLDTLLRGVEDATRRATRTLERLGRGARRALIADSSPPATPTPRFEVWSRDKVRLYRYRTPEGVTRRDAPPVLFVMSLVTTSLVFDLQADNSVVRRFLDDGWDVFLLDWGVPDAVDATNTLETYCDEYLPRAVAATDVIGQGGDPAGHGGRGAAAMPGQGGGEHRVLGAERAQHRSPRPPGHAEAVDQHHPWSVGTPALVGPGLVARDHSVLSPPSTTSVVPVTYDEAREARNSSAVSSSCCSPNRPRML